MSTLARGAEEAAVKAFKITSLLALAVVALFALPVPASADQGRADGTQPLVAEANFATCVVRETGGVMCAGNNAYGQIGNGTTGGATAPSVVTGVYDAIGIYGGYSSFCALLSNRNLQCWGSGTEGQLGNGKPVDSSTPSKVFGLSNVATASLGRYNTCAVRQDGTVWCWGAGDYGIASEIGAADVTTPVQKAGVNNAVSVAVGDKHACAVKVDGSVWCWGNDQSLQLGDDSTATDTATPVRVAGLSGAVAVTAGNTFTCALLTGGTVSCWGSDSFGELGNGLAIGAPSGVPQTVRRLSGVTALDAGANSACAITGTETRCWGAGNNWQLGTAVSRNENAPVLAGFAGSGNLGVAIGAEVGCAVMPTRYVWCWGGNSWAEAGDGVGGLQKQGYTTGDVIGRVDTASKVAIKNSSPGAPTGSSSKAKTVTITWAAPSTSNGTSAPTDYTIQYKLKGTTTWKTFKDTVTATRSVVVTGLTSGKYYQFRVYPKNWAGTGAVSTASGYIKSR